MVKKNKINLDIINSISSSSPMKSNSPSFMNEENTSSRVAKEFVSNEHNTIKTKKKLITIPEHWEDSIKEYLNGSGTVSSYLIQAIREKLREDKLI
jgi:hypothetical protein